MPDVSPPRPVGLPPVPLAALARVTGARIAKDRSDSPAGPGAGDGPSVSGVTLRSDSVRPGDLFAAVPGSTVHGATFVAAAVAAGAVAVLTDPAGLAMMRAALPSTALPSTALPSADLPTLVVDDPRRVVGAAAAAVYGDPSRQLSVIGVTGTSGKTTTCYFIEAALAAAGVRAGLIGTVAARAAGERLAIGLTTPEAPDLQALLAVMHQRGVQAVAIEVSSHALVQGRVTGTEFAVGAFTNLSQDHLDFHGDMESYFAAKKLLFDGRAAREVVVIDDEYGRRLAADRPAAVTVATRAGLAADFTATARPAASGAQQVTVFGPGGLTCAATVPLPGAFNVANAVTALACVAQAGFDPVIAATGLAGVVVPGRLERVDAGQPFLALVDYAHKPAAVAAVLDAVRVGTTGRVIVVVGAGGDRDHGKRPMMGAAAAQRADVVIVTDDNPRSEDPAAIRAQVLAGARSVAGGGSVTEIGDRRAAIAAAVAQARAGDVVLIAGKGHELGQEIAGVVHPFSDRDELAEALGARPSAEPGRTGTPGVAR